MKAYGCVKCQRHHADRDPEFQPHLRYQSKHGIYQASERLWAKARLTELWGRR